jgi:hypothetical protein
MARLGDILGTGQQQPENIALLARGISLLSITQLRDLLREYSLPTGGNKHILVNRLIIFLETFGQNQQNLLSQFATKLKIMLAVEPEEPQAVMRLDDQPTHQLPTDISARLFSSSPSCLFDTLPHIPAVFGPVMIHVPHLIGYQHNFSLGEAPPDAVPILQFCTLFADGFIRRLTIQLSGIFTTLRDNVLWLDVSEFLGRQGNVQIVQMEPPMPLVLVIRWMRPLPLLELAQKIITERESAPEVSTAAVLPMNGVCPLTRKIIARPARGVKCAHPDCFDLTGFLGCATKSSSWVCPICHGLLRAEDLRIDCNYFRAVSCSKSPMVGAH